MPGQKIIFLQYLITINRSAIGKTIKAILIKIAVVVLGDLRTLSYKTVINSVRQGKERKPTKNDVILDSILFN